MKKLAALVLAVAMIMSVMMIPASAEVTKPQKITIFIDGTVVTQPNGQAEFKARWEELSGIELEIIQPDHDAYYDVLQQQIASGDWPDVMILSSTYYAAYAKEGVLWDMTDAWDASATKNSGRVKNLDVIEGLKIDGRLYGFADGFGMEPGTFSQDQLVGALRRLGADITRVTVADTPAMAKAN